ncbi:MAG: hypothetical protein SPL80_03960, partial [Bacilli bacterium]|nr:hypothetical protein [Bacilli bacterium]
MKTKTWAVLLPLLATSLTSCGAVSNYADHLEDYVETMRFHEKFNILQLTDIHWSYDSSTLASRNYLDKLLQQVQKHITDTQGALAKIDLIEITGDQFMLANAYHVETFLKFFEEKAVEYGFLYTAIWGNHDRHGLYNPNWLSDQFSKAEHCIFIDPEDNLYGRSNFVINLTEDGTSASATKWQLANLDSGASFSETAISPFRDYDYIREDQVDWWLKEHARVGESVPTIAYYHIPQQDNLEAWNAIHNDGTTYKHKFFKLEGFADNGNEAYASKFIEEGRNHNLKAAFMGHAHNVDWTVDYKGVVLGLGVKTGTELYFAHIDTKDTNPAMVEGLVSVGINENFDLIGASLVTLQDGNNF